MSEHDDRPVFGALLLGYRRAAGMSQTELSKASGVSVRALRDLERGRAQAPQQRSAEVLASALGLSDAEQQVLLTAARAGRRRTPHDAEVGVLNALPPAAPSLLGRNDELTVLRQQAVTGGAVAFVGPAGVGKTSLVATAVHELKPHFADGLFWIDLRGMDDQPVTSRVVLTRLAHRLGVATPEIPLEESELVDVMRWLMAGRKMLVVLDNAADEAQVRPLLTDTPGCLTVITSRKSLTGLEGVRRLRVGLLTGAECVELLSTIVGAERVKAETEAAAELVDLCGYLPLAVRIVGNRLASRPSWSVELLVDALRDVNARLFALSAGDLQVRTAFEMSYRRLSSHAARLFRRLVVVPGPSFGFDLARQLADVAGPSPWALLDELAEANLIQPAAVSARYQYHDLIRLFAAERLDAEESQEERERLIHVVLDHLVGTAIEAAKMFYPDYDRSDGTRFASPNLAEAWLRQEDSNWVYAQHLAIRVGRYEDALELAKAMHWYSDARALDGPWDRVFRLGTEAARALGNDRDLAMMLNFLGWAQSSLERQNEAAIENHLEALAIATELDDREEQAWANAYLSAAHLYEGRPDEAHRYARQAVELSGEFGFWTMQLAVRTRLSRALHALGRYAEVLEVQRGVLTDAVRHRGEVSNETWVRQTGAVVEQIGYSLAELQQWEQAAKAFHDVRRGYTSAKLPMLAGQVAFHEGVALRHIGDYARARKCLELARDAMFKGDRRVSAEQIQTELALLPDDGEGESAPSS